MLEDATGGRNVAGTGSVVDAPVEDEAADDALLESLLVEEVSIDGMCGVY
jgi:mycofactocin precursor